MTEPEFFWDWLKHENNTFNNRSNLFVVAESMLVAAASAWTSTTPLPLWLLSSCGLLVTVLWLCVNLKHIRGTHPVIAEGLKRFPEHPWYARAEERTKKYWWSNHDVLGFGVPAVFILVWLAVLVISV